jgi:uncharacterized cupin superfamily protein
MTEWFVKNVRDAFWVKNEAFGAVGIFEPGPDEPFEQFGINIRVLEPGKANCHYHRENLQEDFLVLQGEGLLLVEGEERPVKAWDFIHLPPETDHVMVGTGDGPCVVLMVGARSPDEKLIYPVSELAAKYGGSAEKETSSPEEAYANVDEHQPGKPASWDQLPWVE